jgi:hypothetical protein
MSVLPIECHIALAGSESVQMPVVQSSISVSVIIEGIFAGYLPNKLV